MDLEPLVRRAFFRRLVATPAGRAHVLNLMIHAEEGDEAGVFDQLQRVVDDARVQRAIARHQEDERRHAAMYRSCLRRTGVEPGPLPDALMIIRTVARVAGGAFAAGLASGTANRITSREDIMNTYALLLAIEQRGVQQFPLIGQAFRDIGEPETADVFDRVTRDEARHVKYCQAIGRRYAPDDRTWAHAVEQHRAIEERAFKQTALAGLAYAIDRGLAWQGPLARLAARLIHAAAPA